MQNKYFYVHLTHFSSNQGICWAISKDLLLADYNIIGKLYVQLILELIISSQTSIGTIVVLDSDDVFYNQAYNNTCIKTP